MLTIFLIIKIIITTLLIFVHLKSGISKFRNPYAFFKTTRQYNVIKNHKSLKIATTLIVVFEFLIGICIVFPSTKLLGSSIGITMQLIFLLLMINNYGKEFKYGCGCFGINAPIKITVKHIFINIIIIIGFIIILL